MTKKIPWTDIRENLPIKWKESPKRKGRYCRDMGARNIHRKLNLVLMLNAIKIAIIEVMIPIRPT